jgi:hypothetical protein
MLLILRQARDYRLAPLWLMWTEMKIGSSSVHPYAGKKSSTMLCRQFLVGKSLYGPGIAFERPPLGIFWTFLPNSAKQPLSYSKKSIKIT